MYAGVIVDIAHSQVDKIYEYSCDDTLKVGCRVKVPFGGRIVDGFVVGVSDTCTLAAEKIKPVAEVFDELPALVDECFFLMERISSRYKVPKVSALRLFLPSEMRVGRVREIYKKVVKTAHIPVSISKSAKVQAEILSFLETQNEYDYTALCDKFSRQAVVALEKKGAIEVEKRRTMRSPAKGVCAKDENRVLTPAQENAIKSIEGGERRVNLIHGVTGSGKTEVYLQLIARAIERGKTAIFLVPEISLTPQMLSLLRARFKDAAAIMHSGLSAGEKFDEWWRLRTGEAKIAVGARSAIFAPMENLGLIVIDEEHDGSYFSESAPRYSTFDIALSRAEYNDCKLVLGSATPSIESYSGATSGTYNLIKMPERINKRALPEITVVDMRREVKRGNPSPFSAELRDELKKSLDGGNQAMIFLNRRGYSQKVICRECGYVAKCDDCDASLTYHSEENCLKCHYCGKKYRMLASCPECGGLHIRYSGTGTQRVSEELKALFPAAKILRMDNDSVSGKDGHYKILSAFSRHEADILVGTQMIAKGHDFPSVTLVGILDADMSLYFDDYRSGERTFQLITQVAGRSGRADSKGEVILQTFCPENAVLRYATRYDYEGFYESEVALRRSTLFPPFALICRVMVTSEDDGKALDALKTVYLSLEEMRRATPDEFIFLNRMHSPVKRIQGKHRYQALMRLKSDKLLGEIYASAVKCCTADCLVYVEENPSNLS